MSLATARAEASWKLKIPKFEQDMVYLFAFKQVVEPANGLATRVNSSYFCSKVMLYLTIRKIAYTLRTDVFPGPRGQLPFMEVNGMAYAESETMVQVLDELFPASKAHPALPYACHRSDVSVTSKSETDAGWALLTALQRIIEADLYFCSMYYTWAHPTGWAHCHFFEDLWWPLRPILEYFVRRSCLDRINKQGTLKLHEDERLEHIHRGYAALAHFLGQQNYYVGDSISMLDVLVYAMVDTHLATTWSESPMRRILDDYPTLIKFHARLRPLMADAYKPSQ